MAKYKVGDEVIIRDDLEVHKSYPDFVFTKTMKILLETSRVWEIKEVCVELPNAAYRLVEDPHQFYWQDDMIQGLYNPIRVSKTELEEFLRP